MDSANGTAKPAKLRVTETDLNQVSQELNRAVGKESTCKQNALVAASADRQAKALLEAATRNRQNLEQRYADIVDRLGEQNLEQLAREHDLPQPGKLSPEERATAVAEGDKVRTARLDPLEVKPEHANGASVNFVHSNGASFVARLAEAVATRFPVDALVRVAGKADGPLMRVIEVVGAERRVRILEGAQALDSARFNVTQLEEASAGNAVTQRVRIDDVAGKVHKGDQTEELDKAEDKPRRKFSELSSEEQEACELIDGDQNPRYRLGDELVDSDRADGDQTVRM